MGLPTPLLLIAQIAAVLAAARAAGALARTVGQPRVVGEMAAGIALGPSVLGAVAPSVSAALFPASQLGAVALLGRVGAALFMFVVGLRLDHARLASHGRGAAVTSAASIALPFAVGTWLLGPWLAPTLAGPSVSPRVFATFVGAALSVTAFPVLARILAERDMVDSHVGTIALTSAAFDDVFAWIVLAWVLAATRAGGSAAPTLVTIAAVVAYASVVALVARPLLRRMAATGPASATAGRTLGAVAFAAASAWAAATLGAHALFGAFLAGAVMARERGFASGVADRIERPVAALLLPLFFAYTGLRTSIGLVSDGALWGTCLAVIACAVVTKVGAATVAAGLTGTGWREAFAIGALMNTRGLMELVILTIGLDAGVISQTLFAIMVTMALATTLMTAPLLSLARATPPRVALP